MAHLLPGLGKVLALLTLAGICGRMLAPLAREVRLAILVWLALRGTQPDLRPEILRALPGAAQKIHGTIVPPYSEFLATAVARNYSPKQAKNSPRPMGPS